jgi:hypothetical protein
VGINKLMTPAKRVQQEMMSTLPEIFLFPLSLSLSSGTGGEKEERERGKIKNKEERFRQ